MEKIIPVNIPITNALRPVYHSVMCVEEGFYKEEKLKVTLKLLNWALFLACHFKRSIRCMNMLITVISQVQLLDMKTFPVSLPFWISLHDQV